MESYGPLRQIRSNRRFAAYEGVHDGEPVFIKCAVDRSLVPRLLTEAVGLRAMGELDAARRWYRVPDVIALGNDYIVTQWAQGSPMERLFELGDPSVEGHIGYLFELYAYVDSRTEGEPGVTRYNLPNEQPGVDRFMERAERLGYDRYVDGGLVRATADFIRAALPTVQTRFTNGDLQPGNLLVHDGTSHDGRRADVWLVDCETTSWLWPRHYNAVNFAFNYALRYPRLANQLYRGLAEYCTTVGSTEVDSRQTLNLNVALRCLGVIIEELSAEGRERTVDPAAKRYVESAMRRIVAGEPFFDPAEYNG